MTTTLTSDEREEQPQPELLFVELRSQHTFTVKPEPYIETVEYLRKATVNAHYEDLMRATLLREESAATRMRDLCVEKVKALRDQWLARLPNSDDATFKSHYQTRADAATEVITTLQSLTLDNQQPVKEESCCISALIHSGERAARKQREQK